MRIGRGTRERGRAHRLLGVAPARHAAPRGRRLGRRGPRCRPTASRSTRVADETAPLTPGDQIKVGIFELDGRGGRRAAARPSAAGDRRRRRPSDGARAIRAGRAATIVRSLADFTADYGLADGPTAARSGTEAAAHEQAQATRRRPTASKIFGFLTRLARLLMHAPTRSTRCSSRVMDIAFEALPVDRGFILLRDDDDRRAASASWRASRSGSSSARRARCRSRSTMLEHGDDASASRCSPTTRSRTSGWPAASRSASTRSAPRCARRSGRASASSASSRSTRRSTSAPSTRSDLDLLTALANYAAVAVERIRYAADGRVRAPDAQPAGALPLAGGDRGGACSGDGRRRATVRPAAARRGDGALRRPRRASPPISEKRRARGGGRAARGATSRTRSRRSSAPAARSTSSSATA